MAGPESSSVISHSNVLFQTQDGRPLTFYCIPGEVKTKIRPLVKHGGGKVTSRGPDENCIKLAAEGQLVRGEDTYSYRYILDCVEKNTLLPLEQYKMRGTRSTTVSSYKTSVTTSGKGREPFLKSEQIAILKYVAENSTSRKPVGGNKIWKEMELYKVTKHSWHAMRDHYLKQLKGKEHLFDLNDRLKYSRLQFRKAESQTTHDDDEDDDKDAPEDAAKPHGDDSNKNDSLNIDVFDSSDEEQKDLGNPAKDSVLTSCVTKDTSNSNVVQGSVEVSSASVGSAQEDSAPVGSAQVDSAPVGSAQEDSAPMGSAQVDSAPVGSAQVDSAPVVSAQEDSAPVGSAQEDSAPMGPAEVDSAPAVSAQVGPAQVDSATSSTTLRRSPLRRGKVAQVEGDRGRSPEKTVVGVGAQKSSPGAQSSVSASSDDVDTHLTVIASDVKREQVKEDYIPPVKRARLSPNDVKNGEEQDAQEEEHQQVNSEAVQDSQEPPTAEEPQEEQQELRAEDGMWGTEDKKDEEDDHLTTVLEGCVKVKNLMTEFNLSLVMATRALYYNCGDLGATRTFLRSSRKPDGISPPGWSADSDKEN
ncbi:telomeric repeat-binding factor 2-interacting protein 1-like isoform X2 [Branchiostoma lanceolatum]|uniref:telomeric repeat-binding factor 2-interacting protein 1-like isoform X2 n=1 Tax=Branchiostoma lanceolatum TaxID=7740 RepID=UPI003451E1ED